MSVENPNNQGVGGNVPIRDAVMKATGSMRYTGDMKLPHMLHAKVLFSPLPHAKIIKIDTSKAEALEGVHGVVCYKDSPNILYNGNGEDKDYHKTERVFDQVVRYVGDKVAAVAADTEAIAAQAVKLIEVEYEELPYHLDTVEAMQESAYPIHNDSNIVEEVNLSCGNVDAAMKGAYKVYEDTYTLPAVYHSALETHVSIANYEQDGKLTIYTPTQDVFGYRENLQRIFGLSMNKIRVVCPVMGGGFGGKIDLITEPITVLLSMKVGRPVRLMYTRKEDMISSRTRHAMKVKITTGVDKEGHILAQDVVTIMNAGAYTSATMSVCWAMGGKLFKSYQTDNLRYRGIPVYTNTAIASAMRGFGSPQLNVPQQCQMNKIANDLGISIIDMQLMNLVNPGDMDKGSGAPLYDADPKSCVEKGKELFHWDEEVAAQTEQVAKDKNSRYRTGIGMAVASHGNGIYGVMPDTTGIILKMNEDGSIVLFSGVCDMGSGSITTQTQAVSEVLGISLDKIECVQADTEANMYDLGAYASRGTFVSCHAVKKVAEKLRKEVAEQAAELLAVEVSTLEFNHNSVQSTTNGKSATLKEVMIYAKEKNEKDMCATGTYANCSTAMSYGAHFAKVLVDMHTKQITVTDYVAVHDVGTPINPLSVEGQIQGGIQMGMGYALSEELIYNEKGKLITDTFKRYHMIHATEMPKMQVSTVDNYERTGPFGAKSIGECATVPVASAIVNAVSNAIDRSITQLPIKL